MEQSHHELSEDSDDYEPPEPDTSAGSPSYSPHYTPSDNPSMKPGPLTALDENLGESVSQSVGEPQPETSMQGPSDPTGVPQHPTEFLGASRVRAPLDQASSTETDRQFTPYDSSLKMFRAYRFHPDYLQNVSDGYRSLTYSHNIDSTRTFCPYESSGGVCNDNTCGFQHFRDITLSDDKILVQMGALREGQTEEEKEAYVAGLKEIINGMRRDKVKEFSTVANEIAAYRRRVLQDPSRVLHL
ncbi:hypothetical protein N7532_006426 [Penicillium argentinense]|uniref:Putative zinc-finger domain-containing protein n=1 Tax=Penicillium argentinense TaxID=1131581 RepID=A0A9W9FFS8_9EURO|nr:uncharacterized protein N7532_006426 [Penicillium argentinense]KAJ5099425.1 hypothetical protein N7532_006426 [Penicillium argentinense]